MRQRIEIVLRVLQSPIRRQLRARGQLAVHDGVGIFKNGFGYFGAVARIDQHRPPGQRSKIKAYRVHARSFRVG